MLGPKCYGREREKKIKVRGVENLETGRDHTNSGVLVESSGQLALRTPGQRLGAKDTD